MHRQEKGPERLLIPTEQLGVPGIPHEMHIAFGDSNDDPSNHDKIINAQKDGTARDFTVTAHLAKEPGKDSQELKISLEPSEGGSFIRAHPDADTAVIDTYLGQIQVHVNAAKEFSALSHHCKATGIEAGFAKYSEVIAPLIDHMSFHNDIPVFTHYIALYDHKHKILTASYVTPYAARPVSEERLVFDLTLKPFYALYREAVTNSSVYYQFLCYAKILEGIIRKTYPELLRAAKELGMTPPKLDARVEPHKELSGAAKQWVGRTIQQTFNDYLQPEFRDAIAHFSLDDSDPIVVSNYISSSHISNNLLLARMCARGAIAAIEKIRWELAPLLAEKTRAAP
ncbi:methylamine utilization protein MauJ [Myxococcus sp. NMCA1]|uniref:methylamine utilization protein MauJ n=1 Tax=Myxococcus sp. NMCA1 TaxID=2996785 RepID=UPI00228586FD|nr:methylamine utilization protein MauJ [Myxococcus sp. NMCA1]WAM23927.1 hypothetical protein OZ403_25655 [Myxococcus sp. NMCA1]